MYIPMCSQTKSSFRYIPAINVKESQLSHLNVSVLVQNCSSAQGACVQHEPCLLHLKLLTPLKIKVESGQCPQIAVNQ